MNTKDHKWAAITCVTIWLICCAGSAAAEPPWPSKELITSDPPELEDADETDPTTAEPAAEPPADDLVRPPDIEENFLQMCEDYFYKWWQNEGQEGDEWPAVPGQPLDAERWAGDVGKCKRILKEWADRISLPFYTKFGPRKRPFN